MGGSGLTEDEARDLVKVGCICYDLSKEGLTGAVSACSLPTRSATIKDREHAWSVWVALLKMKNKFPKMKLGISKEDKKFPWEWDSFGAMVELADTANLKFADSNIVPVQIWVAPL
jgi:hypothetical protein